MNVVVILILLAIYLVASAADLKQETEPIYSGRPLSAWVKDLPVPREFDQTGERYATNAAVIAVRKIGMNGLPFLLRWFEKPGAVRRMDAEAALIFLGDAAKPAIPQLSTFLNSEGLSDDAAIVLRQLGLDGIQALTNGFASSNSWVRSGAVLSLCSEAIHDPKHSNDVEVIRFQQQRRLAIPGIIALLHDPNYEVGVAAALALPDFSRDPELVNPALIRAANDTNVDARVRKVAVKSLSKLGVSAGEDRETEKK